MDRAPEQPSLLEEANFIARFAAQAPRHAAVRQLHQLLSSCEPRAPLAVRLDWLEDLTAWVTKRGRMPGERAASPVTARLEFLLEVLEALPEAASSMRELIRSVLAETSAVRLFTDTGLPSQQGFLAEAADRLSKSLLPQAPELHDTAQLLLRLFPTARAASWLEGLSAELRERLLGTLWNPRAGEVGESPFLEVLRPALRDAVLVLSARIAALGLADDVRARSGARVLAESPFVRLRKGCDAFLEDDSPERVAECREAIGACRRKLKAVTAHLEESGVRVDLVYRLDLISQYLARLYTLLALLAPGGAGVAGDAGLRFSLSLVRGGIRDRSLRDLGRRNVRLIARKVIERAGSSGEHYITVDAPEYHRMISSAGGGGVLTAFTALFKFLVGWANLPPLVEGAASALNYAGSFVAMQLFGFTLATKQPSMTAAALAGALKETSETQAPDLEGLVDQIACIARSQLAAVIGNLGMVVPSALLIDGALRLLRGRPLLEVEAATYVARSLDPLHSGTLAYAVLTGVCLWLASIGAGALENWAVYRRLPAALASHRAIRRWLGPERAERFSRLFLRHISGFGGSLSLGLLLAGVPLLGKLSGLPLDVRHVTLSTGALTFAGASLGSAWVLTAEFARAAVGVAFIGLLNFGVSFALALYVALRAREVGALGQLRLVKALLLRFVRSPRAFFLPPSGGAV